MFYPLIRGSSSTTPVNLPGPIELEIFQRLETGELNRNLFVEAENSIRDLLRYDSYRRFLKSKSYKWVEAQTAVNPKLAPLELKEIIQACIRNKHHDISTVRKKAKRRQSGIFRSILDFCLVTKPPIFSHGHYQKCCE